MEEVFCASGFIECRSRVQTRFLARQSAVCTRNTEVTAIPAECFMLPGMKSILGQTVPKAACFSALPPDSDFGIGEIQGNQRIVILFAVSELRRRNTESFGSFPEEP